MSSTWQHVANAVNVSALWLSVFLALSTPAEADFFKLGLEVGGHCMVALAPLLLAFTSISLLPHRQPTQNTHNGC